MILLTQSLRDRLSHLWIIFHYEDPHSSHFLTARLRQIRKQILATAFGRHAEPIASNHASETRYSRSFGEQIITVPAGPQPPQVRITDKYGQCVRCIRSIFQIVHAAVQQKLVPPRVKSD